MGRDTVKFAVVECNLVAYRPQTEGPGYGNPFPRTEIPFTAEDAVGIRRNGDNDNGGRDAQNNPIPDYSVSPVANENDLIEIDISLQPASVPGLEYRIRRGNQNIEMWPSRDKSGSPYFNTLNQRQLTGGGSGWIEWMSMDPAQMSATLEIYVWDATHQREITSPKDTLTFRPFQGIVIAFGGDGANPLINTNGTFGNRSHPGEQ